MTIQEALSRPLQVLNMMGIIPLLFCNDTPRDDIPARAPVNHGGRASDDCENIVLLQRLMHIVVCQGNITIYLQMPMHAPSSFVKRS